MNEFYMYLKRLVVLSLAITLITSCATTDYVNDKPDDFTTDKTLPNTSFPEEGGKSTEPPVSPPPVEKTEPPSEEKKEKVPFYLVQQGDTLSTISRRSGHSVAELAAWNQLEPPYHLSVGQKLIVDSPTVSVDKGSSDTHEVVKGDTLYTIAKKYGRTTKELATWNNLEPPYLLTIGQILRVSPKSP